MNFVINRIELNGSPNWQVYQNLHAAMKRNGFSRFITDAEGMIYHLPNAEYSYRGDLTVSQVCKLAYDTATSAWHDVQTLSTQGQPAWIGLRKATPSEISAA